MYSHSFGHFLAASLSAVGSHCFYYRYRQWNGNRLISDTRVNDLDQTGSEQPLSLVGLHDGSCHEEFIQALDVAVFALWFV